MDPKVEWIFPGKINLSSQQLEQLNYEISADQVTSLNEYFFRQDGYVPLVHLRLVLKNINHKQAIIVGNIEVYENCQLPLRGALINVTGMIVSGAPMRDGDIQLGYVLRRNLAVAEAEAAPGLGPNKWVPGCFLIPFSAHCTGSNSSLRYTGRA